MNKKPKLGAPEKEIKASVRLNCRITDEFNDLLVKLSSAEKINKTKFIEKAVRFYESHQ